MLRVQPIRLLCSASRRKGQTATMARTLAGFGLVSWPSSSNPGVLATTRTENNLNEAVPGLFSTEVKELILTWKS
jgi:hypothetical protein